jgi:hypothetical protein
MHSLRGATANSEPGNYDNQKTKKIRACADDP